MSPVRPTMTIEMLPADHGDCLWIECHTGAGVRRLLVDCGTAATWKRLRPKLAALPPEDRHFELLIVTHVDSDHIGGVPPLLEDDALGLSFGDVWFNGFRHLPRPAALDRGARQGETVSRLLDGPDRRVPWNRAFRGRAVGVRRGERFRRVAFDWGLTLTVLSPTRGRLVALWPEWHREIERVRAGRSSPQTPPPAGAKGRRRSGRPPVGGDRLDDLAGLADRPSTPDGQPPNGSSIAVLAEFGGRSCLLAGDAFADVLEPAIRALAASRGAERLPVDAFKLPHHASQANVTTSLIEAVTCPRYLVSTNGHLFHHPDPEAMARTVLHGGPRPTLHFNYRTEFTEPWGSPTLMGEHGYDTRFPDNGQAGLTVAL